jgi:alkyl hydroperoxide reductase subunit F
MTYDLAIIGGGPAGVAAGVYAARKRLKTAFITKDFDGQSAVSLDVQNWIGTVSITGADLSKNLENHLRAYAGDCVDIHKGHWVEKIEKKGDIFFIQTKAAGNTNQFEAKTILITSGSSRRKLEVPGAAEFDNKGLTYCASCDGPLFADMDVVVVGGGNAGFDSAAQLLAYCPSVTLLARNTLKGDKVTIDALTSNPKFKALENIDVLEIKGDKFVTGIKYKKRDTGEIIEQPVGGVFIEIGSIPNTGFVQGLAELDSENHIKIDHKTQRTSVEGIWAAGDATDGLYHQNNIAAGDAIKALEDLYLFLRLKR